MQREIRTVGIYTKPGSPAASNLVPELLSWLESHEIQVRLDDITAGYAGLENGLLREEIPEGCDLVIVLGGDGTLLSAARHIGRREVPVFPVNLGSLGFLTAIKIDELFPELERALHGQHRVAKRRLMSIELERRENMVGSYLALNDAVVTKASIARMIEVEAFVDGNLVCNYKADGLIVATSTGSTAYSLSAGGPIVFPSVAAFCITPICPHMLTNRPVIVPESSLIRLVCHASDDEAYLTIDGQVGEPLKQGDEVVCRTTAFALHLIRPPRMLFFDVLREKLKWGER